MYIILGRGRKSGVARATGATASLAPMWIIYISFLQKKTFQIISFSIHIYFFLFENTINTLFMLSWAWFFWSDWFCNSGFWIGASEISFGMKWFVTLYMSHVTFSWNIMVIGLLDSKLSEEFDIFTKKWIAWAHPENEITLFVGGFHLTNIDF